MRELNTIDYLFKKSLNAWKKDNVLSLSDTQKAEYHAFFSMLTEDERRIAIRKSIGKVNNTSINR